LPSGKSARKGAQRKREIKLSGLQSYAQTLGFLEVIFDSGCKRNIVYRETLPPDTLF
jgi:hypothetical protein